MRTCIQCQCRTRSLVERTSPIHTTRDSCIRSHDTPCMLPRSSIHINRPCAQPCLRVGVPVLTPARASRLAPQQCQHRRLNRAPALSSPNTMATEADRPICKETTLPPYDEVVDKVWKQAFPVDLLQRRAFERPLEWGVADWSFSNHNEDCSAELAVVKELLKRNGGSPLRTMCVASAGETATALAATEGVQEIQALDMVNGQVMLTRLRFAAMLNLPNEDYKTLFGLDVDSREQRAATEQSRVAVYEKLREKLPDDVRGFFDGLKDKDIAFGVGLSGKVEQWTNVCHRNALAAGKIGLYETELWHQFRYADLMVKYVAFPPQWMEAIKPLINFTNYTAGVQRLARTYLEQAKQESAGGSGGGDDAEVVAAAAEKLRRNYFVQLFHTGALGCGAEVPDCYRPDVQKALQERVASGAVKFEAIQGDIIKTALADAASSTQPLAFITLSNIFDFAPTPEAAMVQLAPYTTGLAPGTTVLVRTTLTARCLAEGVVTGAGLLLDEELTGIARAAERSPMFGNVGSIAVGIVPPKTAEAV